MAFRLALECIHSRYQVSDSSSTIGTEHFSLIIGSAAVRRTDVLSTASILNAASYLGGPVAPGEIISIFGSGLGPSATEGSQFAGSWWLAPVSGTEVLVGGVPVPLFHIWANQVNTIVPYSINTDTLSQLQVYATVSSPPSTIIVPSS
jgi:hypothetical protein